MIQLIAQWLAALMITVVIGGAVFCTAREFLFNRRQGLTGKTAWLGAAPHLASIAINLLWVVLLLLGGFWR